MEMHQDVSSGNHNYWKKVWVFDFGCIFSVSLSLCRVTHLVTFPLCFLFAFYFYLLSVLLQKSGRAFFSWPVNTVASRHKSLSAAYLLRKSFKLEPCVRRFPTHTTMLCAVSSKSVLSQLIFLRTCPGRYRCGLNAFKYVWRNTLEPVKTEHDLEEDYLSAF
jgi:hypothetical protein